MIKNIGIGLICILFCACKDEPVEDIHQQKKDDFAEVRQLGIYDGKRSLWSYDELYHQLALGEKSFRLQTDAQDKYFFCELLGIPQNSQKIGLSVTANGIRDIGSGTYTAEVVKMESRFVWLWDEQHALGYLIQLK